MKRKSIIFDKFGSYLQNGNEDCLAIDPQNTNYGVRLKIKIQGLYRGETIEEYMVRGRKRSFV